MFSSPSTPKSKIVSSLRRLWLTSRERSTALRVQQYTCQRCGVKQSKKRGNEQKVQVHHKEGILNWDKIIQAIREQLLVGPDKLEVLCPDCHSKETYKK